MVDNGACDRMRGSDDRRPHLMFHLHSRIRFPPSSETAPTASSHYWPPSMDHGKVPLTLCSRLQIKH